MIGVIVVGPRREHNVRIPAPDLANDLLAHVERGQQLPIMIVENVVLNPLSPRRFLCLGEAALRQFLAMHGLMARITIGDRYEFNGIARLYPKRGGSGRANITIVRMGPESDDANLIPLRHEACGGA